MKKSIRRSLWLLIMILTSVLIFHVYKNYLSWIKDPFLEEIYKNISSIEKNQLEMGPLVEKYIQKGSDRRSAIAFLSRKGFVVRVLDTADLNWSIPCGESWYYAEKSLAPYLLVKATVYIEVRTKNGLVEGISGRVWYSGI